MIISLVTGSSERGPHACLAVSRSSQRWEVVVEVGVVEEEGVHQGVVVEVVVVESDHRGVEGVVEVEVEGDLAVPSFVRSPSFRRTSRRRGSGRWR